MPDGIQQLLLKITGDSAGAQRSVQDLTEKLGGLKGSTDGPAGAFKSLGATITNVFENPVGAVQNLSSTIGSELTGALKGLGPAAGVAAGGLAVAVGAVAAVGAATFSLAEKAATAGESQLEFSRKTGIAVQNVGALEFASKAAGGGLDQLTNVLRMVEMRSQASGAAGDKFKAALHDIGIEAANFNKMDNESKVMALAEGFQRGAKSGNTMADAMVIMGRAGVSNLALLNKLNPELLKLGEQLGVTFTPEMAEQAEHFKVELGVIQTALGNIGTKIGLAVMPAVEGLLKKIAQSPEFVNVLLGAVQALTHGLGYLIEGSGYVVTGFGKIGGALVNLTGMLIAANVKVNEWIANVIEAINHVPGAQKVTGDYLAYVRGEIAKGNAEYNRLNTTYKDIVGGTDAVYNATVGLGKALTEVTLTSGQAITTNTALNRVHTEGAGANAKFAGAVEKITESLQGEGAKTQETLAALRQVLKVKGDTYTADIQDVETKTRVVQAIEKLQKAHIALEPALEKFLEDNQELSTAGKKVAESIEKIKEVTTDWERQLRGGLLETVSEWATRLLRAGAAAKDVSNLTGLTVDAVKRLDQSIKDTAKSQEQTTKLWEDHAKRQAKATSESFDDQMVAAAAWRDLQIDALNKLDLSLDEYERHLRAIDAVFQDMTAEAQLKLAEKTATALAKRVVAEGEAAREVRGLWQQTYAIETADLHTQQEMQIADIQRGLQSQLEALRETEPHYKEHYDALVALAQAHINEIVRANDPVWQAWRDLNRDMRGEMASTWEQVLNGTRSWKDAMLQPFASLGSGIKKMLAGLLADIENQFFSPLIRMAHDYIGRAMGMLSGAAGPGGGGINWGGILGSVTGQGGAGGLGGGVTPGNIGGLPVYTRLPGAPGVPGGAGGGAGTFARGSAATGALAGGLWVAGDIAGKALAAHGHETLGSVASYAGKGAAIGTMVMPGIGTAVGAGVGALTGFIKAKLSTAGRDAVKDFADQFKQVDQFGKVTASGFDVLHEKLDKMGASGEQLWVKLTQGVAKGSPAQAKAAIDAVTDALDKQAEKEQKAADEAAKAAAGLKQAQESIVGAIGRASTAMDAQKAATAELAKLQEQAAQGGMTDELEKQIEAAKKGLKETTQLVDVLSISSQQSADAMAGVVEGAVAGAMASGESLMQAIGENAPAIKQLQDEMAAAGLQGDATFGHLTDMVKLASDAVAGPALASIEDYSSAVKGLAANGSLSESTFQGLEGQIGTMITKLEGYGYDHGTVMEAVQSDLQTAWEAQQRYGYSLDETTQKLVDEAVQDGKVGESHKSTSSQMLDYTKKMSDAVVGLAKLFGVQLPDEMGKSQKAAGSIKDAIEKIPGSRHIDITYAYSTEGAPPPEETNAPPPEPGAETEPPTPSFARRPIEWVTKAGLALLHPGDIVGAPTPDRLASVASSVGLPSLGPPVSPGGGGATVVNNHYPTTLRISALDYESFQRNAKNMADALVLHWATRSADRTRLMTQVVDRE